MKKEFIAVRYQLDNMFSREKETEKINNTEKIGKNIQRTDSTVLSENYGVNFGMGEWMTHLMNTNTNEGGPSLKVEIKKTVDVREKATTTTDFGTFKVTGSISTSLINGSTSESISVSAPVKAGIIPNATLTLQGSVESNGFTNYAGTLSGSGKIGKTTISAGASITVSGNNQGSSSTTFSAYTETTEGDARTRNTFKSKF